MNKRLTYLYCACFVFCGGHFEILICARSAKCGVWNRNYGNRSEPPRSSKKMTRVTLLPSVSDRLPPRICEFSHPSQTSVISVPDFALAARVLKIQNSRHKTQNTRDKGRLIFYSYSKRMWGLPVCMCAESCLEESFHKSFKRTLHD